MLTDWGIERQRLQGMSKAAICKEIKQMCGQTGDPRRTKEQLISTISLMTASQYTNDGMLQK